MRKSLSRTLRASIILGILASSSLAQAQVFSSKTENFRFRPPEAPNIQPLHSTITPGEPGDFHLRLHSTIVEPESSFESTHSRYSLLGGAVLRPLEGLNYPTIRPAEPPSSFGSSHQRYSLLGDVRLRPPEVLNHPPIAPREPASSFGSIHQRYSLLGD